MSRLPTFRKGGIHPHDHKELSCFSPVEELPCPDELIVPLSQHLGAPAKSLKVKGDPVVMGEKIGEATSFISADIHAPASGTVKEIRSITLANSVVCDAIVITVDKEAPPVSFEKQDYDALTKEEMLAIVKDMGVVGTGGATFPTNVKLMVPRGKHVQHLVINGVECEPYLTSDHRLMLEQSREVIEGILIAQRITEADTVIIGVENNKPDAIDVLKQTVKAMHVDITVMALEVKYPQGDEKQLLKATINREIPSGKLPLDVGAVVLNVGTTFAIYEAVAKRKPLIDRIVTVSGEAMNEKKNVRTPIGTTIGTLIDFAGGFSSIPEKLVSGGPMMGFAFYDHATPVIKGTSGLLALNSRKKAPQTACIRCGKCIAVCPMGLQPTKLYRYIDNRRYEEAMQIDLMDCKECGCCAYTCPAQLPLVHAMKLGKRLGRK